MSRWENRGAESFDKRAWILHRELTHWRKNARGRMEVTKQQKTGPLSSCHLATAILTILPNPWKAIKIYFYFFSLKTMRSDLLPKAMTHGARFGFHPPNKHTIFLTILSCREDPPPHEESIRDFTCAFIHPLFVLAEVTLGSFFLCFGQTKG